ncbi:unnamed protein product [Phytophthora fragariaefolia]|uniref:Unnamed protein product n=1 Tax=Phytophthora fragariaefolia TaxID=1490495 RepID=A0A9W6TJU1_9STRA|nr:unnamed protein product [Phytophthora fragariaefolia]
MSAPAGHVGASDGASGAAEPGQGQQASGNIDGGDSLVRTAKGRASIGDFLTRNAWATGARPSTAGTHSDDSGVAAPRTGVDTAVAAVSPASGVIDPRASTPEEDDVYSDLSDEQVQNLANRLEHVMVQRLQQQIVLRSTSFSGTRSRGSRSAATGRCATLVAVWIYGYIDGSVHGEYDDPGADVFNGATNFYTGGTVPVPAASVPRSVANRRVATSVPVGKFDPEQGEAVLGVVRSEYGHSTGLGEIVGVLSLPQGRNWKAVVESFKHPKL